MICRYKPVTGKECLNANLFVSGDDAVVVVVDDDDGYDDIGRFHYISFHFLFFVHI
jgi:hypothetical protein